MKINIVKTFLVLYIVFLISFFWNSKAYAYGGNSLVMPPVIRGVQKPTLSRFNIDTTLAKQQKIETNLYYVQAVTIELTSGKQGYLLVREKLNKNEPSFDFIVPGEINADIKNAKVFLWYPDSPSLIIWHYHGGKNPVAITATKVHPVQKNTTGDLLWEFTTQNFSEFYINAQKSNTPTPVNIPYVPLILVIIFSATACLIFKENDILQGIAKLWPL